MRVGSEGGGEGRSETFDGESGEEEEEEGEGEGESVKVDGKTVHRG